MTLEVNNSFSPINACRKELSLCFFLILLWFVFAILGLIIYILVYNMTQGLNNSDELYFSIALIIICMVSITIVLILTVSTVKEACFVVSVDNWTIFSQNFTESVKTEGGYDTPNLDCLNGRLDNHIGFNHQEEINDVHDNSQY